MSSIESYFYPRSYTHTTSEIATSSFSVTTIPPTIIDYIQREELERPAKRQLTSFDVLQQIATSELVAIFHVTLENQEQIGASEQEVEEARTSQKRSFSEMSHPLANQVWSKEEDQQLIQLVTSYLEKEQQPKWFEICKKILRKTESQCRSRWFNTLNPEINKKEWTKKEDELLISLVSFYLEKEKTPEWAVICKYLPGRTDKRCRVRWTEVLNPNIKKGFWTKDEDNLLISLISPYVEKDKSIEWTKICEGLNGRTPHQCRDHWEKVLNPAIKKKEWSQDEDTLLIELVTPYLQNNQIPNWAKISTKILGRTDLQCRTHWIQVLDPNIKKGEWSKQEDENLIKLVNAYLSKNQKPKWTKISELMLGRTYAQCRIRWNQVLDPTVKKGEWSKQEDENLIILVNAYLSKKQKPKWVEIAKKMSGRKDVQCRQRWVNVLSKKPLLNLN